MLCNCNMYEMVLQVRLEQCTVLNGMDRSVVHIS